MAIASSTPVLTLDGWKRATDLSARDTVFDDQGDPQPVASVQHYIPRECYVVSMDDGTHVVGDRHLSMILQTKKWRDRHGQWQKSLATSKYAKKSMKRPLVKKSALELFKGPILRHDRKYEYSLAVSGPVKTPWADLPVPAYVFGIWAGTRSPSGYHWVPRDMDLEKVRKRLRAHGFFVATRKSSSSRLKMEIRPSVRDSFLFAGMDTPYEIPFLYLLGSVEQRQELLEGLEDARDSIKIKKCSKFAFSGRSWHSIRQRQALLESLGYKTLLSSNEKKGNYQLTYAKNAKSPVYKRRFVRKIEKIEPIQCVHVETERPMLVAEGFLAVC